MIVFPDLEAAAVMLRTDPNYRVLRRFVPRCGYNEAGRERPADLKVGIYADVETTGLDVTRDQIIELALVPFLFDHCGNVYDVGIGMAFLNDPGVPIPADVAALTGITDAMVSGHAINDMVIEECLAGCALVVAHKADFDRPILERRIPTFAAKPWACSYRDVEWSRFGCVGGKLAHILEGACGEFYEAHRAIDDCRVGVHVLASAQLEGRTALSYLLESARKPTFRVWASDSPFELKDTLKQRGYRWHDGVRSRRPKAWYRDCAADTWEAERDWLAEHFVFAQVQSFHAADRYSARVG